MNVAGEPEVTVRRGMLSGEADVIVRLRQFEKLTDPLVCVSAVRAMRRFRLSEKELVNAL